MSTSRHHRKAAEPAGATSLRRMLGLLDVFSLGAPVWSADDLIAYLGVSRSTGYRYIRTLQQAGLLAPVANGSYVLGSRIIELDRQIRMRDPVYTAGGPPMQRLARETGHNALLCVLYSDSVMCVREELNASAPEGLFSRGQRRTLFSGAASKVILAHLPVHQLRTLYARNAPAVAEAGMGEGWDAFRVALRSIRKDGHCVTLGEFSPGILGIAAPVFNRAGKVLGSLGIAMSAKRVRSSQYAALADQVMEAAGEATERICKRENVVDLPARAVG
jgi:DNA-binding IclR family transcriptional regulator